MQEMCHECHDVLSYHVAGPWAHVATSFHECVRVFEGHTHAKHMRSVRPVPAQTNDFEARSKFEFAQSGFSFCGQHDPCDLHPTGRMHLFFRPRYT